MKRILLLALCLVFAFSASAESSYMRVVNCQNWVSLRDEPGKSSARLLQVSLGAIVTNCVRYNDEFTYCEYGGKGGYILSAYLEDITEEEALKAQKTTTDAQVEEASEANEFILPNQLPESGIVVLDTNIGSRRILAVRVQGEETELLNLLCLKDDGSVYWGAMTESRGMTELTLTDAFLCGAEGNPCCALYNAEAGLYVYDIYDGSLKWKVETSTLSLGGSISHLAADDGTVYIAGYYGPDPVAIKDGVVLWKSAAANGETYWPCELRFCEGGITCLYASNNALATISLDGQVISVEVPVVEPQPDPQVFLQSITIEQLTKTEEIK